MEELKITKDKIIEAANKCSTAKQTLKILFPEAFEEEYYEFGSRFRFMDEFRKYPEFILTRVQIKDFEFYASLTSVKDGHNWSTIIKVANSNKITKEEFRQLHSSQFKFEKIN
jgi:hypothetical protein